MSNVTTKIKDHINGDPFNAGADLVHAILYLQNLHKDAKNSKESHVQAVYFYV